MGVRLDGDADWAEIAELCQDAYRAIAPARLAALLDTAGHFDTCGHRGGEFGGAAPGSVTPAPPCP